MPYAVMPASLEAWLIHLENLHPRGQAGIELGLDRVRVVSNTLGQKPFCPVITVAGTNGKGSTCAYLENMLLHAGYRVGCYTSPHLVLYNERIRLNGQNIDDAALCSAFERVELARVDSGHTSLTYFEFGTLAAWEVFADADVEAIILEVGLGGRLDAVNLYEPDVAIVTRIGLDHTEWLGNTREAIAVEKAGIFRAGKPALCADPDPPASLVKQARETQSDFRLIGTDFGFTRDIENRLQWFYWHRQGEHTTRRNYAFPGLRGSVQLYNAAVALAALDCLDARLHVTMQARREGLILTDIPGRFQVIPGKPAIVLDVGHNPQATAVLADNLSNMGFFEHTFAVVGMLADKDAGAALLPLKGKIHHWFCATLDGQRGAPASRLAKLVESLDLGGTTSLHETPADAFAAAQKKASENDRIAAFGSFLTVADTLTALHRI
jgi:dihydrofolate synthase / folylpolyglutamate synthase